MKNVVLLLAAWLLGLSAVEAQKHSLTASDLHKRDGLSETRGEEAEPVWASATAPLATSTASPSLLSSTASSS